MSNIQLFSFESNEVRVFIENDEPWFVGKDVATVLGYSDTNQAIRKNVDYEDKRTRSLTGGATGTFDAIIINESGLYSLILRSRLKTAKSFKRWITSEVLPSIRKTEGYISPSASNDQLAQLINTITQQQSAISNLSNQVSTLEIAVHEGTVEKEELREFKKEVNEYERFVQLLDIAKTKVSDDSYAEGITVFGYLVENKIPIEKEFWITLSRRTAQYFRLTKGKDPYKNKANQNVYSGKDIAFIAANIRLLVEGI